MFDEREVRDGRPLLINLSREPAFVLAGVKVAPASRELISFTGSELLQPRIMQVLVALARRRGQVVSRDDLTDACWGGRAVGEDAINRCIQAIRRLAEAHGGFEVQTIPRVGYRLTETTAAPRAAGAAPDAEPRAERRHLTALSCGLARPAARDAMDPEEWRAVVQRHRLAVAEIVAPFGGYATPGQGDNLFVYFGYPDAQEDAAECAVRAGLAIAERARATYASEPEDLRPAVRMGVHAGVVLVVRNGDEPEFVGEAPDLALHIQIAAARGALMITDAVRALVAGLFLVEPPGGEGLTGALRVTGATPPARQLPRFAHRDLSPYVGREDELHLLAGRWRKVQRGDGQLVLLTGEPGIGKTRLVQEFRRRIAGDPHLWVETGGERLNANTPFHTVARMLDNVIRWRGDETPAQRVEELELALARSGLDLAEAMPLVGELLDLEVPETYPPLALAPDQKRRRLLACLTAWVFNLVRNEPLVIAIEDLQWTDPSSMEVLLSLVEQGALGPLMLVCTARPEFRPGWALRAHHVQAPLGRLSREETRSLVRQMAVLSPLDDEVVDALIGRTDGVPLFAEELTRLMLGRQGRAGARDIPATLYDSLQARLARTGRAALSAQLGAVIGREFSHDLIAALSPLPPGELQAHLEALAEAELIYVRGVPPEASYQFKHALILDAAYGALSRDRRRALHGQVARTLIDQFPDLAQGQPELLARHWAEAGEPAKAVDAWVEAGNLACGRHAYREAIQSFEQGLAALEACAPSAARTERELEILILLSEVVGVVHGHANAEYALLSERMADAAERTGDMQQVAFQMLGRYVAALMSGQHFKARGLADQFLELARREGGDTSLRMAYMAQISSRHAVGDMSGAESFIPAWTEVLARAGPSSFLGENSAVYGVGVETAYMLGRFDLARRRAAAFIATNEATGSPFEAATALQTAAWLEILLESPAAAAELAGRALAIARENNFHTANQLTVILAFATALLGDADRALTMAQGVFDTWSGGGYPRLPEARRMVAQIRGLSGDTAGALAGLDAVCDTPADNLAVGAAHRIVRGDLRLALGEHEAAELDLRAALDLVRPHGVVALELRAALPLARSLVARGRTAEARLLLGPVCGAFADPAQNQTLQAARALLEQLP